MPPVLDIWFDYPNPHPPGGWLFEQFCHYLQKTGWRYQFSYHEFVKPDTLYEVKREIIYTPPAKLIPLIEQDILKWEKRQRKLKGVPAYEMVWIYPRWFVKNPCPKLTDDYFDDYHDECENWLKLVYHVQHSIARKDFSFSISFWFNEFFWYNQKYNIDSDKFYQFIDWLFPLVINTNAESAGSAGELAPIFLPVEDIPNAEYVLGEFYIEPVDKPPFSQKIIKDYYWRKRIHPRYDLWVRRDLF